MMRSLWQRGRVTPVTQMESAECGVACLAMVLGYHGCWMPLAEVRALCGTSRDGNSAFTLVNAARGLGLTARGRKLEPIQLRQLRLSAILHWDLSHFVVLESVRRTGVTIVDPSTGRRFVRLQELGRSFTGVALTFQPGDAFRRRRRLS